MGGKQAGEPHRGRMDQLVEVQSSDRGPVGRVVTGAKHTGARCRIQRGSRPARCADQVIDSAVLVVVHAVEGEDLHVLVDVTAIAGQVAGHEVALRRRDVHQVAPSAQQRIGQAQGLPVDVRPNPMSVSARREGRTREKSQRRAGEPPPAAHGHLAVIDGPGMKGLGVRRRQADVVPVRAVQAGHAPSWLAERILIGAPVSRRVDQCVAQRRVVKRPVTFGARQKGEHGIRIQPMMPSLLVVGLHIQWVHGALHDIGQPRR